jgi:hypothetical protein
MVRDHVSLLSPTSNLLFIGYPGVGKTGINNRIRSLFPARYIHKNLGIIQVPILKIECPIRASTLQLCRNFFLALDISVGSNYSHEFRKASEPELMRQMYNKACLHVIGLLLIDEIHNLKVGTSTEVSTTLNFLKFLTNMFKVPVIFIGTPQAEDIFNKDLQNASRVQTVRWNRVLNGTDDWDIMIEGLWRQQVLKSTKLTPDIKNTYYKYSQGIYRILVTLHLTAQRLSLTNQWDKITPEILEMASKEEMFLLEVMILALQNKQMQIIELFDDMREESKTSKFRNEKLVKSKNVNSKVDDLMLLGSELYNKKVDKVKLDELVQQVLEESFNENFETQARILSELVNSLPISEQKITTSKLPPTGELLDITQNAETSLDAYNLLKEAGIIKPVLDLIEI